VSKGNQIAIGAVLCAALLGWYGYSQLGGAATYRYFQTLDEFLASDPASATGRALRIKGYVTNGTIDRALEERSERFAIQNAPPHGGGTGDTLAVLYPSLETPDLFQDGAEVVVEGHVDAADGHVVFVAENVLAKCPSKFQAAAGAPEAASGTNL